MKSICLALVLSLSLIASGEQSGSVNALTPAAENRALEVLKSLPSDNELRLALERGERGNGVRYVWMDKMQQLRLKQAAFIVDYELMDRRAIIQVKSASFLRGYYAPDTQIKDKKLLRQIRDSGLEERLNIEILDRAHPIVLRLMEKGTQGKPLPHRGHVTIYLNLLDDEALPILDEMPKVEP